MTAAAVPTIPTMPEGPPLQAYELESEHKDEFIRLLYEGHRPDSAARQIGTTGTQFRRLRNPKGAHYDEAFAKAYREAIASPEHQTNFLERVRDAVWNAAENGNARLLEKLSLIHDPDWEPLRHANLHIDMNVVARILPYLSDEEISRAIRAAEAAQAIDPPVTLRALPPAEEAQ